MRSLFGEFIGTFVMVFIGCGSVAASVYYGFPDQLWQVALCWWIAVTLATYISRHFSPAHLNPAVSLAMLIHKKINGRTFFQFSFVQLSGAFLAAGVLYLLVGNQIAFFEESEGIIRGSKESIRSAMAFGEFFPNPGNTDLKEVSHLVAFVMELIGTFALVKMVFLLSSFKGNTERFVPVKVGLTVALLIMVIAPYTQCGINPARDLGPRLFAALAGWKQAAFTQPVIGSFTVYVLGPLLGAGIAALSENKKD